jgi:hypothetical protein
MIFQKFGKAKNDLIYAETIYVLGTISCTTVSC